jgi:MFS family permease
LTTVVDRDASDATTASSSSQPILERLAASRLAETMAVLVSPVVLFYVLRMRPMAPNDLPDPGIHTAYIVHSRDMFARYFAVMSPSARMREAYRIGFLAPAHLFYELFGALPGFFVTRYFFALIAIAPTYLLLRRLYGRPAAALGVIVVLSNPVFITAWGTDYPDSALIAYATGALACMAMPSKRRGIWVALGAALYTAGVWTFGVGAFVAVAAFVGLVAIGLIRDRKRVLAGIIVFAGAALIVTIVLSLVFENMFGHLDFIRPTFDSARFLSQPEQTRRYHSTTWRWAPYVAYLLVPPAVAAAWAIVFVKKRVRIPTPQLTVGLIFTLQLLLFMAAQFLGSVQVLEMHYFSSALWSGVCLTLAIALAEIAQPLFAASRAARWLPAALLLVIPLVYETDPHVPAFGWGPFGYLLVAGVILAACAPRLGARFAPARHAWIGAATIVVISGCVLVLTVAPIPAHHRLSGSAIAQGPPPAYASALGGTADRSFAEYRIETELPKFVGPATYTGDDLLLWWNMPPHAALDIPAAQYHTNFNSLIGSKPPMLTAGARQKLALRKPTEILLFDPTDTHFSASVAALDRAGYDPVVLRKKVLRSGELVMHAWLIQLRVFAHGAR